MNAKAPRRAGLPEPPAFGLAMLPPGTYRAEVGTEGVFWSAQSGSTPG